MHTESGVKLRTEDHTVARIQKRHPNPCRSEAKRGTLGFGWQLSRRRVPKRTRCGKHLEILWEAMIDGIYTATYACKVSRTVGFA